jgi:hypothetical protein
MFCDPADTRADLANPNLVLNIQPGLHISSTPVTSTSNQRAPNLWPSHTIGTSQNTASVAASRGFTFGNARAAALPGMPPIGPSHGE